MEKFSVDITFSPYFALKMMSAFYTRLGGKFHPWYLLVAFTRHGKFLRLKWQIPANTTFSCKELQISSECKNNVPGKKNE